MTTAIATPAALQALAETAEPSPALTDDGENAGLYRENAYSWTLYSHPSGDPFRLKKTMFGGGRASWQISGVSTRRWPHADRMVNIVAFPEFRKLAFWDLDGTGYVHTPLRMVFEDDEGAKAHVIYHTQATVEAANLVDPDGVYKMETPESRVLRSLQLTLTRVAFNLTQLESAGATPRYRGEANGRLDIHREKLRNQFGFRDAEVDVLLRLARSDLHPREMFNAVEALAV